jgi:hypothetical protein
VERRVDAGIFCLGDLGRIGIDADQVTLSDLLQDDPGQQPITAAKVEAATLGQSVRYHLFDLDRTPQSSRGLKRILVEKADEQFLVQRRRPSSCSS